MNKIIWYLYFSDLLNIVPSSSILVITNILLGIYEDPE